MKRCLYILIMFISIINPIIAINSISNNNDPNISFPIIFSLTGFINCFAAIILINKNKKILSLSNLLIACFFFFTVAVKILT